jgi:hypothetical protein
MRLDLLGPRISESMNFAKTTRHLHAALPILGLISGGLAGCGSGDETKGYKLVPVSGTVTINGKAVEGVDVNFTPSGADGPSTPGHDTTGPEGNYKMMYRDRSGLSPGKYTVLVTQTIYPGGTSKSSDEDPHMARAATWARAQMRSGGKGEVDETPKQIQGSVDKEVPASGGIIDLDVKGSPAPIPTK